MSETHTILKGKSFDQMAPLVSMQIPSEVKKLNDMRKMLARFKYMSSTDSFLTSSGFPIHHEDEPGIEWKEALVREDNKPNNKPEKAGSLLILSRSIDRPAPPGLKVPDPIEFGSDKPGEHGGGDEKLRPRVPKDVELERAEPSDVKTSNAKILNKEQIDEVFDINNVFGGVSFIGPVGATATIFESPKDLSRLIWVCDGSSLEVKSFTYSTQASMFKEGATGVSAEATFKGVTLGGGFDSSYSYSRTTGEAYGSVVGIYRYPRAVIRLPIATMQPTEKFKNELAAALAVTTVPGLTKKRLVDFFSEYGQGIASEIYLGGHLHTNLEVKDDKTETTQAAEKQVRAGLSLPFGLGVSASHGTKKGGDNNEENTSSDLVVEAVGGDTLLSSNLKAWPSSVMPHTNWRITRRAKIDLLINIPSLFNEKQRIFIENLFGTEKEFDLWEAAQLKPPAPKETRVQRKAREQAEHAEQEKAKKDQEQKDQPNKDQANKDQEQKDQPNKDQANKDQVNKDQAKKD